MKITNILLRLLVFPPILFILIVAALRFVVRFGWMFLRYGGELIHHQSKRRSIAEVYDRLDQFLEERKNPTK